MDDLGELIDAGVKVALLNGDRDYRYNCMYTFWGIVNIPRANQIKGVGVEAVSLGISH
jgi:hypothetical protein